MRAWREDDVPAFFDIYSRDEVARWIGPQPRKPVATLDDAVARLGRWRDYGVSLAAPLGLWAIVPLADNSDVPIGTALLLPLSDGKGPTGDIEVGWHLHPDHHGKGYATEAAAALLDAAGETGITQVLALTDLDNVGRNCPVYRMLSKQMVLKPKVLVH